MAIVGTSANDIITGTLADDTLDGAGGSDTINAGAGNDVLVYRFGQNKGANDIYNGGTGTDTLQLIFTQNELNQLAASLGYSSSSAYLTALQSYANTHTLLGNYTVATFGFNLTTTAVENLQVVVSPSPLTATADGSFTVFQGSSVPISPANLVANDISVTGDLLGIIGIGNATHGSVRVVNGQILFTATAGYTGGASFTYTLIDQHGNTAIGTVSLNVSPSLIAQNDGGYSVLQGNSLVINPGALVANDTSLLGDHLGIIGIGGAVNGNVSVVNGQIVFTPSAGYAGAASFTYTLIDQHGNTALGTVSLNVTPKLIAQNDSYSLLQGNSLAINPGALVANDTSVTGDQLGIIGIGGVSHGNVSIANGQIVFTPSVGYAGAASFTYTLIDQHGDTVLGTVSLNVVPKLIAQNDFGFNVFQGSTLTINPSNLVINDSSVTGDHLGIVGIAGAVHGNVSVVHNQVMFTATSGYIGIASFTYTLIDQHGNTAIGTVFLNVTTGLIAQNDTGFNVMQGSSLAINPTDLLANDASVIGDHLGIIGIGNAVHGNVNSVNGQIIFAATAGYTGGASFTYTLIDQHGNTALATVNLNVISNHAPVANSESFNLAESATLQNFAVLSNDTDADNDVLTINNISAISSTHTTLGASVAINPADPTKILYNPGNTESLKQGEIRTDTFNYTISDGHGGTSAATVTINITGENDAPIAHDDVKSTNEDTALTFAASTLVTNDTDIEHDQLTVTGVSNATHGTVALDTNTGLITFTPDANYNGAARFDYAISDGNGGTSSATVNVTINSINDAPIAHDDAKSTNEDTPLVFNANTLITNDTDIEHDQLTVTGVSNATHGTVALDTNTGLITFTPDANYNGAARFDYAISDGNGGTSSATVNVTINSINDVPVAHDDVKSTNEDTPLVFNANTLITNDTDIEHDQLTVTGVSNATHGTVALDTNTGLITFTPDANYNGAARFDYAISDGNGGTSSATVNVTIDPVNDAPVAHDDAKSTNEDTPLVFNANTLITNDTDIEHDQLTVIGVSNATHGTVALDTNTGLITFTPDANYNGAASFDYAISDGNGGTSSATVNVTIDPVNDAPVAHDDAKSTNEDTPLVFNANTLITNDTDIENDQLTVTGVSNATHGTVALDTQTGIITFTPDANYNGSASFDYAISDGNGGISSATVNVTIDPVNDAPVAHDDAKSTNEDTPLTFAASTLVANDTDIEHDSLTVTAVSNATHGTVALDTQTGIITFTPDANYNGAASFDYAISDGNGGTSSATVNVTIDPVNDAPVAHDDVKSTNEDTPLTFAASTLVANDTDIEHDQLTVTGVSNATHGTVALDTQTGIITFTPDANYNGAASFDYAISDGNGGVSSATVNVTIDPVNDAPVSHDDVKSTNEDTALTFNSSDLVSNDTDIEHDSLTITAVSNATHGTVALDSQTGIITFTPDANYNGAASFDYAISDGNGGVSSATVNVTIDPVNDAPVAHDDIKSTNEDTPLTFAASTLVANDTDIEHDQLTVTSVSNPTHGTVALDTQTGLITFTPDANYNGAASFDYAISDGNGGTSSATVNVTINPVNDAPVAHDDVKSTNEDTPLTFAASTLVANDTDIEHDQLTVTGVSNATHGTVALDTNTGLITFTPDANYNGPASFDYAISDGNGGVSSATVNVTIDPVNDAPVAHDDVKSTNEDTALTFNSSDLITNDTDIEHDQLTVTGVGNATHGTVALDTQTGLITFTPDANYNGAASFDYAISDGNGGVSSATVNVTIDPVNDAPVAHDDTKSTNEDTPLVFNANTLITNDTDIEHDQLTVTGVSNATHGTVALDTNTGLITFTPDANYNGPAIFDYAISDGNGGTSSARVNITIDPVNDAPVAHDDVKSTNEDTALTFNSSDLVANDTDIEHDQLTVTSVSNPTHGTVALDTNTGLITFTPDANYNGAASFDYAISDGNGGVSSATVNVTIDPVNDAPVAHDDVKSTNEDTPLTFAASTLVANDTDIEHDQLTVTSVSNATHGSVALDTNTGLITFTPDANYNGAASFDYAISDGNGGISSATVNVTIDPVNDPPIAHDDAKSTNEDTPLVFNANTLITNDTDIENDQLTVTGVSNATHGTVALDTQTGIITFTPDANYNGAASFDYAISDGNGGTSSATVNVTIDPVNDAPVAHDDAKSTNEDTPLVFNANTLITNDTDIENDQLTVTGVSNATHGTVALDTQTGIITFTPDANYNGAASFDYAISDGNGGVSSATVNITIDPVNDTPVAHDDVKSTNEDTPLTFAASTLVANDTDIENDQLTVTSVSNATHGTVALDTQTGLITFTPDANYNGSASFDYAISDGNGGTSSATVNVTIDPVNDAPVAHDDAKSTNEDTPLVFNANTLITNDTDIENDQLTVTGVSNATHGTVALDTQTGIITFTPDANYNGSASFDYAISDGNGGISSATVNVTIDPVNDAPVAHDDTKSTNEDTPLTFNSSDLITNDTDIENDQLTVTSVGNATHGTVALDTNTGLITFTPDANYNGSASFDYAISDGNGGVSSATVNVTIDPVNDAPVAHDDTKSTNEDTPLTFNSSDLITNDTDIEHDQLTVTSVSNATHGTVALDTNTGLITFTPDANYNGAASFDYAISDGNGGVSSATVNVTIDPVNDAPVAHDDTKSTNEDTPLTFSASTLVANDTDIEHDQLTVTSVSNATHGTVALDTNTGLITFTPDANYNGAASFDYAISDGNGGVSSATVNVTIDPVNDAPVAHDDAKSTNEDTPLTFAASTLVANDTDIEHDQLTVTSVSNPTHGTVALDTQTGLITFTPDANYNGPATFDYAISDGNGGTSSARVNITIDPVNDAPVAHDDVKSTNEDTPLTFNSSDLITNDTDIENDQLTVTSVSNPTHGTVALDTNTGLITFTPDANYNGAASFDYAISDGNGGTSSARVNITIDPVNDAPVAHDDEKSTNEDTPLTFAANTLITNDTDIEHDQLTVTSVSNATHGTVALDTNTGLITFTPDANYNGAASFDYAISDGNGGVSSATVNVTIDPVNDAPVAHDDVKSTNEDTPLTFNSSDLITNDTDIEHDQLTVTGVSNATHGTVALDTQTGIITFTPDANYNGAASFDYAISDGNGGVSSATVNVTIDPVNDAPVAHDDVKSTNEDTPLTFAASTLVANDTDIEHDSLTVTAVSNATHGTVALDTNTGLITFTPDANYNGAASFDYAISDGNGGTSSATVNVTIDPVNDAPVAHDDVKSTNEDTPLTFLASTLVANDTDIEHDQLTVTSVSNPTHGTVALDTNTGLITFTPDANYNGAASFDYAISDGNGGTSSARVNITIDPVNDAPVAHDDAKSTNEDTPLTFAANTLITNDTDIEHDQLTVTSVSNATHGTVALDTNTGLITFTPDANYNGAASFDYAISDGNGGVSSATVNVTIDPVNDAPVAHDDVKSTNEDTPLVFNANTLITNDTDIEHDSLTVTAVSNASHGTVALDTQTGIITFTPDANYNGAASFDYAISDGNGGVSSATVNVTIDPVNDAPVAHDDAKSTNEDTALTFNSSDLVSNDTDIEHDSLTVTAVSNATHGTVALDTQTGIITFTPDANYNGAASFDYAISDGNGGVSSATVNVTIDPVNDAPVAHDDAKSTNEDTPLTFAASTLVANDTDIEHDQLTVTSVGNPTHGTVILDTNTGLITFTPDANYNGSASFDYAISDGNGGVSSATVNVTIDPVNDAPVAHDDVKSTNEDTPLTFAASTLVANDTDIEHDQLTVTSVGNPTHGTVILDTNTGLITFTPDANYNGSASFDYAISDGNGGVSSATVNVTIDPVNDAPVAHDDVKSTNEDTPLTFAASTLVANDTDIEHDQLTVTSVSNPTHGTVALDTNTGLITFTPDANYNGAASFDYAISDGNGGVSSATVNVTIDPVNDAPVAHDDVKSTNEDTPLTFNSSDLVANDTDIEHDQLTVTSVSNPTHGTVALDTNTGLITFTPDANYNGAARFDYAISDGNGGTSSATVNVTIDPVNDAPVAHDDVKSTNEDTALTFNSSDLVSNDTDIEHDSLTVTAVSNASHGTVALDTQTGIITFTPDANYNGAASFDYAISDGNGGTSSATVNVTIDPVNDAPVAHDDVKSTNEDTALTFNSSDLVSNDTDIEHDNLTVTAVSNASHGTVALDTQTGIITFTPDANYNGAASFDYAISDGNGGTSSATVNVTIDPVNDAPVAHDDVKSTNEDTPLTFAANTLITNDTDIEHDQLTVTGVSNATHGTVALDTNTGLITFTPDANYNGAASFDYAISDGNGGTSSATVNVTIDPVNDAPVAHDDAKSTNEDTPLVFNANTLITNDTDIEHDSLTVTAVSNATHGTVALDTNTGLITFTPDANYNGAASFDYAISDGNGGVSSATVNVTIDPVNDPPVANTDTKTTAEDTPLVFAASQLVANDTDVDGDALTVTAVTTTGATHGTVILSGGNVTYTPAADYNGAASFNYTLSDGILTTTGLVNVTVTPVNDPPVANADSKTTAEDTPLVFAASQLVANDTDVDGDALTVTAVSTISGQTHGTVSLSGGNITYTPAADYNGAASFNYTLSDGIVTTTGLVNITVTPVNDPPVANTDTKTTAEDTPLVFAASTLITNDTDVDGDALTVTAVSIISGQTHGTVSLSGGNITYTPAADYNGAASFNYTLSDGTVTTTGLVNVTVTPVNDPPVANTDTKTTAEDTPLVFAASQLVANDTDVDGDALTVTAVSIISGQTHGTVSLSGGNITYTPAADYNGAASFNYTLSDGTVTTTGLVNVTVTPVNDPPVANADSKTTAEDTPLVFAASQLVANDTDVDGDALTVTAVTATGATHGTVILSGGNVTYTPAADYNGAASFNYTLSDGILTTSGLVNVTVTPVNDPPVANTDTKTTAEDTPLVFAASTLTTNDTDVDGDALTVTAVSTISGQTHGTVSLSGGNITYTPAADYNGAASFNYTLSDGTVTTTGLVNVTVTPVNDPPVANTDTKTTAEDTPLVFAASTLTTNDTDVDGDALTVTAVSTISGQTHGTVSLSGGNITYTPAADYNGAASFNYTLSDGILTTTGLVNVTVTPVNDPPVANADSKTTAEDTPLVFAASTLITNDTDVDGDALTVTAVTATGATHGTVILSGGNVTYTPAADYNGAASFNYTLSDGILTTTGLVNVTVTPVNDPPVANADSKTTAEDTPLVFAASTLITNDTDVDGDALTVTAVTATGATHGTVILSGGNVTYTPAADYNGAASFNYTLSDGILTTTGLVNVTVTPVNDPPVANTDTKTTAEDTPLVFAASTLTTNDTDVDGDALTVTAVTATGTTHGTVILSGGNVTYTPAADYNGAASFNYTLSDGILTTSGLVNVTVTPVNDNPVAVSDAVTTNVNNAITISPLTNDTDVDGDTLTISSLGTITNGTAAIQSGNTTILFTPTNNYRGPASVVYNISDGHGGTSSATISITVNGVPVATADNQSSIAALRGTEDTPLTIATSTLLANDTDPDSDTLTVTSVSNAVNGTVSLSGTTITFIPSANYNGSTATFQYAISDGKTGTATGAVTLLFNAVNDAPVAGNDALAAINEDTVYTIAKSTLLANDSDVETAQASLTLTTVSNLLGGTVAISGANVVFTPTANYNGPASFQYTVSDGSLTGTGTVTFTINAVNDPPVAVADSKTTAEDTTLVFAASTLTANDTDVEGDTLTVTAVTATGSTNGTVSLAGGNVTYIPAANYNGAASFTYTVSDGMATTTGTVNVTITAVNDAPVAVDDTLTAVGEDSGARTITKASLIANDTDVDNTLTASSITAVSNAVGGTVAISGNNIIFTPTANYNGITSFIYTLSDGALTDTALVKYSVTPINDAPTAVAESLTAIRSTPLVIPFSALLSNDSDVDGAHSSLTISGLGSVNRGTAVINTTNQTITFTPQTGFIGSGIFVYTVSDGSATTNTTATINIAVNGTVVSLSSTQNTFDSHSNLLTSLVYNDANSNGVYDTGETVVYKTTNFYDSQDHLLASIYTNPHDTGTNNSLLTRTFTGAHAQADETFIAHKNASGQVINYTYNDNVYNGNGTLASSTNHIDTNNDGITDSTTATTYAYTLDANNHISTVTATTQNQSSQTIDIKTTTYTYNGTGNIIADDTNYDTNGDHVTDKTSHSVYNYNAEGILSTINTTFSVGGTSTTTLTFDANGHKEMVTTQYDHNDGGSTVDASTVSTNVYGSTNVTTTPLETSSISTTATTAVNVVTDPDLMNHLI